MSIQVTLPIFPAPEAGGGDRPGGNRIWKHSLTSFHPSVLCIEYPPPWLTNIPYLTLIKLSWFLHCKLDSSLRGIFVPLFCASTVQGQWWCVVVSGVQYFISGKIRSSCSIGSQSYHPTDQWTLPFYFLVSSVSTCQHRTRGDTSPFYNNLTYFSLASLWNKEFRAFFSFFCYFLLVS